MKKALPFYSADILIPKTDKTAFSCIACDQFTSQKDYWDRVEKKVGENPSAYRIILPELYLGQNDDERIEKINETMKEYLDSGVFAEFADAMIYVERTLSNGKIRRGIVGCIDLEEYDYSPNSKSLIRATERTVPERIPPRFHIREKALLESPHVMVLIDDPDRTVIEPLTAKTLETVYNFELMTGAGHLKGKLLDGTAQKEVGNALESLVKFGNDNPLLFAVGDGNHSLATALECYRRNPCEQNRYTLVEIVNIHDTALVFEPIYRVMFGVEEDDFINCVCSEFSDIPESGEEGCIEFVTAKERKKIACNGFPVEKLQKIINRYIEVHDGAEVDYIHGLDNVEELIKRDNSVGIIFEGIKKNELFPYVKEHGVLPRKAFSMGEALDKRFYLECRKIK